ncbi:MAG TPA: nitroreductase/quinone reductase family protein [Chloroflexota bacterium]|nr:nitroreductase/quinone reductase family protein [Chloroflexota bacterium]
MKSTVAFRSESSNARQAAVAIADGRVDPAERLRSVRWFYRGWRPTRTGKLVNRVFAWASGLGLTPRILLTLRVKGRSSGRLRTNVLVPATYGGQRYLVSMLGDTSEWVRNVRAAGGKAFIQRGRSHPVMLTEIPPGERAPVLKAYCQVATSGRHHFPVPYTAPLSEFEAIAADYPVFRIDQPN